MKNLNKIEVYTDGSSLGNPGRGGYGVVFVQGDKIIHEIGGYEKDTTNNRMELQAVIETLKYLLHRSDLCKENEVVIYADSTYVLSGATSWIFNWEKNGWRKADKKPVLNKEIWQELIGLVREFKGKLSWMKVKGHSDHVYNDRADEIANICAEGQKKLV